RRSRTIRCLGHCAREGARVRGLHRGPGFLGLGRLRVHSATYPKANGTFPNGSANPPGPWLTGAAVPDTGPGRRAIRSGTEHGSETGRGKPVLVGDPPAGRTERGWRGSAVQRSRCRGELYARTGGHDAPAPEKPDERRE